MSWFVIHTRPRNEKKVAERLQAMGLEVYLPLLKTLKQWSDRKKKVAEPLFKSYLFLQCDELARLKAMQTPGIVRTLYYLGQPAKVREEEIEAIRQFLGETEFLPEGSIQHFDLGDPMTIHSGPLKGAKGSYLARQGDQLILRIESLGQLVQAMVPARFVLS